MKKVVFCVLLIALLVSLGACGNSATEEFAPVEGESPATPSVDVAESEEATISSLVVYFSWSGHTENVANAIAEQTGADIFEIIPQTPYSDDYNTLLDLAQEEQSNDARPIISGNIANINQYDIVYVGFPIWWGDMPMLLYTFFDTYDLSGKTIVPFCTSGGSGLSNTVNTITELEPDATVLAGLHIGSSSASEPGDAVSEWLNELGLVP